MTASLLLLSLLAAEAAAPLPPPAEQKLAREIFAELVGMDTSHETGGTTVAARALARRLTQAGFPASSLKVMGNSPRKHNLVARLVSPGPAAGKAKPLMLLGHLDVVQALQADWSMAPYHLTEKDGYFYGRGTQDMKGQVAIWVASLMRLKREKVPLSRDVLLVLTADEERATTDDNGVRWLIEKQRALIDAELALNEGGGGEMKDGRRRANDIQASEKGYLSFRLEVRNSGGHSSIPLKDNAIVRLSEALARLGRHDFPAALDPVGRVYFQRLADIEERAGNRPIAADMRTLVSSPASGPLDPGAVKGLSAVPYYNARLRSTCVPTRLEGGHADNALPQLAAALVNCRLLPGQTGEAMKADLEKVLADPGIKLTPLGLLDAGPVGAPPQDFVALVEKVSERHFPGVPILPLMTTGATDGRLLRAAGIPTYGISGIFHDVADIRAHGRDERILVSSFYEAQEFLYDLIKELAAKK